MKKIILVSLLASTALFANTIEKKSDGKGGYTYIGFGTETLNYQEKGYRSSTKTTFKSEGEVTSPVYLSGSLTVVNDEFDFSIDATSTLVLNETWEDYSESDGSAQKNILKSKLSDLKILVHYKLDESNRITFGPKYTSFVAKRFNFHTDKDGDGIFQKDTSVSPAEEDISTLYASIGYAYESTKFGKDDLRVKFYAAYSKPIWRLALNTSHEQVEYDDTAGYSYEIGGTIGYQVYPGLELGLFAEYSYAKKSGVSRATDSNQQVIQWPENELKVTRSGLLATWKF